MKNAKKLLLGIAIASAVFIGKRSDAKAYDIVGGKAFLSWQEFDGMSAGELEKFENGTIARGFDIVDVWRDDAGMPIADVNLMYKMSQYVPKELFDYDWYLQKHPELVEICGTDKNAIYTYYANIGQAAGWHGRIAQDKMIIQESFDYVRYAAENPDVAAAIGQDAAVLYNHYIICGIKEGRRGYSSFEPANTFLKVYEISSQIINENMSDREKIKAVHDWMVLHIEYDYSAVGDYGNEAYGIGGAIDNGKAVCQGYADTFTIFMNIQGIDCCTVTGDAGGAHAWNKVKVDGEYYYIDVTWDDPDSFDPGVIEYDYYLKKDPTFGGSHIPENDGEY